MAVIVSDSGLRVPNSAASLSKIACTFAVSYVITVAWLLVSFFCFYPCIALASFYLALIAVINFCSYHFPPVECFGTEPTRPEHKSGEA